MFLGSGSSPAEAQGGGQSFLEEEAARCRNSNTASLHQEAALYNRRFIHCSFIYAAPAPPPPPPHANTEESDIIAEPKEVQLKSKLIFILNSSKAGCWRGLSCTPCTQHTGPGLRLPTHRPGLLSPEGLLVCARGAQGPRDGQAHPSPESPRFQCPPLHQPAVIQLPPHGLWLPVPPPPAPWGSPCALVAAACGMERTGRASRSPPAPAPRDPTPAHPALPQRRDGGLRQP